MLRIKFLWVIILALALPTRALCQEEIKLWPGGAPGFESKRNEPEQGKEGWVNNVHNPSITVYLMPKEKANGTAVLICPGGGHRALGFQSEGQDPAAYLNSIGVTAFVLKYRLAREENSPYALEKHAKEDAHRAIRLIRSRAKDWQIDPNKIGMLGFSAGGEVVSWVAYNSGNGDPKATDQIERLNGKPNFQMLIYPGPLGIPTVVPPDAPLLFMVVGNDDECCSGPVVQLIQKYREAKLPVEAHIYTQGYHGFGMGNWLKQSSTKGWPQRMNDWLVDYIFPSTTK